jgi:ABC-type sugar transport system ATPase subunit
MAELDIAVDTSKLQISDEIAIEMRDVHKWYGEFHVLKAINLTVNRGERIVICGPSGSGKSTLIRCINRLEEHQRGNIIVDGIELTGDLKNIEHIRREVGMCFQHFNLFPHLSVLDNLTLAPLWVRKWRRCGCARFRRPRPKRRRCITWKGSRFRNRRANTRASSPVVSSSVWRLPGRCA